MHASGVSARRVRRDRHEYGLIAALIALAIIAAVGMTGERLVTLFESLIPALK